jgi:hypothetical protein
MSPIVQIKFPTQFSHSVRIAQTAKGPRISVGALANNLLLRQLPPLLKKKITY